MDLAHELTVRLMFQRDLPDVLDIERRTPGPAWSGEDFRPVFHAHGTDGWVAELGGRVVGFVVFRAGPDGGLTLLNLGVAAYWRRQGVGRAMLGKLLDRARATGAGLRATVPESNLPAQLLLRDAGFRAVGVVRGHFGGEDGYLMERASSSSGR